MASASYFNGPEEKGNEMGWYQRKHQKVTDGAVPTADFQEMRAGPQEQQSRYEAWLDTVKEEDNGSLG